MRGVHRFEVHGKLAPHYVGPYKILERCGSVAYHLQLPDIVLAVHNVFHVSQLKKCLRVPDKVVEIKGLPLHPDLSYIEHPIKILGEKERVSRNKVVKFIKSSGKIIQRMKQLGNRRVIFWSIIPVFSPVCQGNSLC